MRTARTQSTFMFRPWRWFRFFLQIISPAVLMAIFLWFLVVYSNIRYYEQHDEAAQADAIAVFGAAEYDGKPSPVLQARLVHALKLYQSSYAPLVITLGGQGGDAHSEGGVGHDFLLEHGVPEGRIIAETESNSTEESIDQLIVIAQKNHLKRILAVSDGTHLYRIHEICAARGLDVITSPRTSTGPLYSKLRTQRVLHEMLSYTLWRLHPH